VITDTTRKPITFFQLPSIYPNDEKYHIYLTNHYWSWLRLTSSF
jgi:hypothetical protein